MITEKHKFTLIQFCRTASALCKATRDIFSYNFGRRERISFDRYLSENMFILLYMYVIFIYT